MADTGWTSPGTTENQARAGSDATNWGNAGNGTAQDDSAASYVSLSAGDYTSWFRADNFGFAIPGGATIDGIEVRYDRRCNNGSAVNDSSLRLTDENGAVKGDDKASATYWDNVDDDAYNEYGGAADNWGGGWTDTIINDADFGVMISGYNDSGINRLLYIDHVQVKITYTEGGGGGDADKSAILKGVLKGVFR